MPLESRVVERWKGGVRLRTPAGVDIRVSGETCRLLIARLQRLARGQCLALQLEAHRTSRAVPLPPDEAETLFGVVCSWVNEWEAHPLPDDALELWEKLKAERNLEPDPGFFTWPAGRRGRTRADLDTWLSEDERTDCSVCGEQTRVMTLPDGLVTFCVACRRIVIEPPAVRARLRPSGRAPTSGAVFARSESRPPGE